MGLDYVFTGVILSGFFACGTVVWFRTSRNRWTLGEEKCRVFSYVGEGFILLPALERKVTESGGLSRGPFALSVADYVSMLEREGRVECGKDARSLSGVSLKEMLKTNPERVWIRKRARRCK